MNYEDDWNMTSPPIREVLARNLRALMAFSPTLKTLEAMEEATAKRGGRVGKSTIDRVRQGATPLNLDHLETIAKVFGLAPWQMLVPGLRPENAQILRSTGPEEDALYSRLGELRELVKQIDALEHATERDLPAPLGGPSAPSLPNKSRKGRK